MRSLYNFRPRPSRQFWGPVMDVSADVISRKLAETARCQVTRCDDDAIAVILERDSDQEALSELSQTLASLGLLATEVTITRLLNRAAVLSTTMALTSLGFSQFTRNPLLSLVLGTGTTVIAARFMDTLTVGLETYRAMPVPGSRWWQIVRLPMNTPRRAVDAAIEAAKRPRMWKTMPAGLDRW